MLELGSQIVALAGRVAAATCRWLLLVAEFDARDGADRYGLASTRALAVPPLRHLGAHRPRPRPGRARPDRAPGAGRRDERRDGSPTPTPGRSAGSPNPRSTTWCSSLVSPLAEHGTIGQLESMVRGLRSIDDIVDDPIMERTRQAGETLSAGWEPDSRWRLTSRLDPEHGALVQSALDAVQAAAPAGRAPDRGRGPGPPGRDRPEPRSPTPRTHPARCAGTSTPPW